MKILRETSTFRFLSFSFPAPFHMLPCKKHLLGISAFFLVALGCLGRFFHSWGCPTRFHHASRFSLSFSNQSMPNHCLTRGAASSPLAWAPTTATVFFPQDVCSLSGQLKKLQDAGGHGRGLPRRVRPGGPGRSGSRRRLLAGGSPPPARVGPVPDRLRSVAPLRTQRMPPTFQALRFAFRSPLAAAGSAVLSGHRRSSQPLHPAGPDRRRSPRPLLTATPPPALRTPPRAPPRPRRRVVPARLPLLAPLCAWRTAAPASPAGHLAGQDPHRPPRPRLTATSPLRAAHTRLPRAPPRRPRRAVGVPLS